jgi:hypothetical protein
MLQRMKQKIAVSDETSPGSTGDNGRPLICTLRIEPHGKL